VTLHFFPHFVLTLPPLARCIISYEGTTGAAAQRLTVFAEGNGGIEALKEKLTDDMLAYCLLRETDQIDESVTVKFAFINWLGNSAPRMQKSRISIHIGPVKQFFGVRLLFFFIVAKPSLTSAS
jgi:hypothetical protein